MGSQPPSARVPPRLPQETELRTDWQEPGGNSLGWGKGNNGSYQQAVPCPEPLSWSPRWFTPTLLVLAPN